MDIDQAVKFIQMKHKNQVRIQGVPYYTHPLAVSILLKRKGFPEDYQIAGLFHDLKEDTDATDEEILSLSSPEVLNAVNLVTKEPGYNMAEYISRIKANDMARMVKLADNIHNLVDCIETPESFKEKTLRKSKMWFPDMARGTVFEDDYNMALKTLEDSIQKEI